MLKKVVIFSFLLVFLISLGGCATGRKQKELEVQGLRNQISVLQAEIQSKDEEISSLRDALSRTVEEKEELAKVISKKKVVGEVKSRPNTKQIQTALMNAGYNPGAIDGRMGKQTREAIRAFQKANNLAVDGKVGKETWELLKEYLYKKVK
jgi:peptidoglycan hydrolase-like protein with peptidoglycan-binding domain